MKLLKKIILGVLILLMAGCSPRLTNLLNLGESRRQMEVDVQEKEVSYNELREDIKNNRLTRGTSRDWIIASYGEPVFVKGSCLIYRHPTEYFSSDLIYLYFDQQDSLASWEIKPAS